MAAYDIEEALRLALNGAPMPKSKTATIRKNFAPPAFFPHKVTCRYSVQASYGGPRFIVEYSKNTISREEVKRIAELDMNTKKYTNVVLLDVIQS